MNYFVFRQQATASKAADTRSPTADEGNTWLGAGVGTRPYQEIAGQADRLPAASKARRALVQDA